MLLVKLPKHLLLEICNHLTRIEKRNFMFINKRFAKVVGSVVWYSVKVNKRQIYSSDGYNQVCIEFLSQVLNLQVYNVFKYTTVLDLGVVNDEWLVNLKWLEVFFPSLKVLNIGFGSLDKYYSIMTSSKYINKNYKRLKIKMLINMYNDRFQDHSSLHLCKEKFIKTIELVNVKNKDVNNKRLGRLPSNCEVFRMQLYTKGRRYVLSTNLNYLWCECTKLKSLYLSFMDIGVSGETTWVPNIIEVVVLTGVKTFAGVTEIGTTKMLSIDGESDVSFFAPNIEKLNLINVVEDKFPIGGDGVQRCSELRVQGGIKAVKNTLKNYSSLLSVDTLSIVYELETKKKQVFDEQEKRYCEKLCGLIGKSFPKLKLLNIMIEDRNTNNSTFIQSHLKIFIKKLLQKRNMMVNTTTNLQWRGAVYPSIQRLAKNLQLSCIINTHNGINTAYIHKS